MENKKDFSFKDYQDPTGDFSNTSLKLASWYVDKKDLLKKILIFVLLFWSIISISFGIYGFSRYFFYDSLIIDKNMDNMLAGYIDFEEVNMRLKPIELIFKENKIFNSATDSYDLATKVFNPNERWSVEVSYRFVFGNGKTEINKEILLPGDERFLISYGHKANFRPNNFQIEILDLKWKRVDVHKIKDVKDFISQRIDFSVDDLKFINIKETGNNFLQFSITNNSIFAFSEVRFNVLFYSNNNLVALSPIYQNNFYSKEKKKIEVTLLSNTGVIDNVKVEVVLDVFDDNVYLPY